MSDLVALLVSQLMTKFIDQRDQIIIDAIQQRLGDFKIEQIESLRGRLTRIIYEPSRREEWRLDGKMLCEFYPAEYELRSNLYSVTQKYRFTQPSADQ